MLTNVSTYRQLLQILQSGSQRRIHGPLGAAMTLGGVHLAGLIQASLGLEAATQLREGREGRLPPVQIPTRSCQILQARF